MRFFSLDFFFSARISRETQELAVSVEVGVNSSVLHVCLQTKVKLKRQPMSSRKSSLRKKGDRSRAFVFFYSCRVSFKLETSHETAMVRWLAVKVVHLLCLGS